MGCRSQYIVNKVIWWRLERRVTHGVPPTNRNGGRRGEAMPRPPVVSLLNDFVNKLLVPAIALIIGTPAIANGVVAVFGLHALFAMLFVGSALLFRKAARGAHIHEHPHGAKR